MTEPIRILHVVGSMNRGGTETMIMNLYRQIDRSKVQFDFMVHTSDKCAYDDEILELGGKIYRVPMFKGTNYFSYQNAWIQFFNTNQEYKIIHGHIGSSAAIYLKLAKRNGCFTIAHSHNTKSIGKNLKSFLYPYFSYPTRYIADFFFGCSKNAGSDRYGKKVVSSDKFKVLNNAIPANKYRYSNEIREQLRKKLNVEEKTVLGHVGRFSHQKNHQMLINIFQTLHKENPDTVLLLVGDGELRKSIENRVVDLGLSDSVIFTGVRSDIPELMQAMDVFVFPSLYEGLGLVAIEAQAAGLRCVVSDSIPKEAFVTDLIKSLPLEEPVDIWAKSILQYSKGYVRKNTYEVIKNNGYDILDIAKWLESFYLKKVEEQL